MDPFVAIVNMECPYTRKGAIEGLKKFSIVKISEEDTEGVKVSGGDDDVYSFGQSRNEEPDVTTDSNVKLMWSDYEKIDWKRTLSGELTANAYFVRKGLIRKAQLAFNIEKFVKKNPDCFLKKAFPESYPIELHHPDYFDEILCELPEEVQNLNGESIWLLKPSLCNRGVGIQLFTTISELENHMTAEEAEDIREWVIQKYVYPPYLIDNRKFHLRAYILTIGNLDVYLYDEVLALFSLENFPTDQSDTSNYAAHLTNTCYQKRKGTDEDQEIDELKAVRLLSELKKEIGEETVKTLWNQMVTLSKEVFKACAGELGFFPVPNCFELFGLDFVVQQNANNELQVYLLEINAEPDFVQSGERLQGVIQSLLVEAGDLVMSHFFKQSSLLPEKHFHQVFQKEATPYMAEGISMKFN